MANFLFKDIPIEIQEIIKKYVTPGFHKKCLINERLIDYGEIQDRVTEIFRDLTGEVPYNIHEVYFPTDENVPFYDLNDPYEW